MARPILQFGTSRFLQAHADLILSEARAAGQDVGEISVVETTGAPASRTRIEAFSQGAPFPVRIRGRQVGRVVDETRLVSGVVAGVSARSEFARLRDLFNAAGTILSNTADRGYELPARPDLTAEGWQSFPELLTVLLRERWAAGGDGPTILPCELVSRNGDRLAAIVRGLAREGGLDPRFRGWLETDCVFVNGLVDRIVSAPIAPIGAVAEPYALWALERRPGFVPPAAHPDIAVVDDLDFIEKRKLFLLNLPHTLLAQRWREEKRRPDETVREIVADASVRGWLDEIVQAEIVPAFGARAGEAADYFTTSLDRFDNPFLDHRIADIAENHEAKIERRAIGLVDWALATGAAAPNRFSRLAEALPAVGPALENRGDALVR
jgi:tagaturonate reductase